MDNVTVWIAEIFPIPLIAASSASVGDTMLSSLSSSYRQVVSNDNLPSDIETEHVDVSFFWIGMRPTVPEPLWFSCDFCALVDVEGPLTAF